MSIFSTGSRAHIACSQGNFWMVDGSGSTFEETKLSALNFSIVELDWFELTLDNVLFQQNVGCMVVSSNRTRKGHVFINVKDSFSRAMVILIYLPLGRPFFG